MEVAMIFGLLRFCFVCLSLKNSLVLGNPSTRESGEETPREQHLKRKTAELLLLPWLRTGCYSQHPEDCWPQENKTQVKGNTHWKSWGKAVPWLSKLPHVLFFLDPGVI